MNRAPALAVAVTLVGCSESTGLAPDDLAGTWDAIVLEFTNPANPDQVVEAVNLGGRLTLTFRADGTFTLAQDIPGAGSATIEGGYSVEGRILTLDDLWETIASRVGDRLTLQTADAVFDFNGDGTPEAAALRAVFERG